MSRLLSSGTCTACTGVSEETGCEALSRRLKTKADRSAVIGRAEFEQYRETVDAQIRALQLLIIDLQTRVTALENP